ncbi:RNA polymerase sigma-70 factor [Sphingobacterium sp. InxBP1]|uniref:RNA polymerase sigma-70 factor n=1 Tax=Sphingobacterium sp. InxBP1 TaxID=2870328 RepID=UPI002243636E|nr:RNA polymerase sigma-70 factor [Sphingobacterium sp. InxBP1]MCW8310529.1 RNA polymerase sigma-70 factor [Sphingobacterium sp. InxBP1]
MSELLIASLKKGEHFAMEQIFDLYWEDLFDAALKKIGDEDAAQDIIQEIFIKLWENREHIVFSGDLAAYLHGAVKFKIINYFRNNIVKDGHRTELAALMNQQYADAADDLLILHDTEQKVEEAFMQLPERMRQVMLMSRKQEKSIKEIARELNISVQTVKNQITSAMKILRKSLS